MKGYSPGLMFRVVRGGGRQGDVDGTEALIAVYMRERMIGG